MHAPAQKRLNFNIKQMGYTSSLHKYSPNKGTLLSLETDFGSLLSSNFPLPPNIDALWDKIGCKASFTQFYSEIQKPGLTDRVLNEFFKERPEIELARRFQEFGRCMKFIFPNMNLFTFMCQPKLDVNHLFSIIPDDSRFLFCSTVRMMNILMQNRSYQEKI
ncbi:hypothetical protein TRFO_21030 [Tritrichomonas foetus]|uniref:Uncharacterized protein n=1 Tax=Tritrichomonas foetus TaxID=1144522 RepID=A0A1J4KFH6_9EUKA|nr:hypothetical protein TRFO_21030 [Tritrichomonas foetus]|eukprot:OHT09939.1 hypothetical protein TRFO_21030 [Tritrichomonas foetus]